MSKNEKLSTTPKGTAWNKWALERGIAKTVNLMLGPVGRILIFYENLMGSESSEPEQRPKRASSFAFGRVNSYPDV